MTHSIDLEIGPQTKHNKKNDNKNPDIYVTTGKQGLLNFHCLIRFGAPWKPASRNKSLHLIFGNLPNKYINSNFDLPSSSIQMCKSNKNKLKKPKNTG